MKKWPNISAVVQNMWRVLTIVSRCYVAYSIVKVGSLLKKEVIEHRFDRERDKLVLCAVRVACSASVLFGVKSQCYFSDVE